MRTELSLLKLCRKATGRRACSGMRERARCETSKVKNEAEGDGALGFVVIVAYFFVKGLPLDTLWYSETQKAYQNIL